MKGTAPRGLTLQEDMENMAKLADSKKNRAENIMIVDMIRNDMGRIAIPGSVKVPSRFDIERYPYVLQMTSSVESQVDTSIVNVFESLFPCGSITGAPKIRTMEIIKELETQPRGIYTGTIGHISPDGDARFNVAIRTLIINKSSGLVECGVGSGIVWDSDAESEYRECLLKSEFISRTRPDFQLLESLLWEQKTGYFLLNEHLDRLGDSAEYFGFPFNRSSLIKKLEGFQNSIVEEGAKIRVLLDKDGNTHIEAGSLKGVKSSNLKIGLAKEPVNSQNCFLYHKTTHRSLYEIAKQSRPDCDDVILWNENEEITESCRSNVVVEINGELVTPPVKCGLLTGTYRRHLLESKTILERIVTVNELKKADRLFTINSVRHWMDAELI